MSVRDNLGRVFDKFRRNGEQEQLRRVVNASGNLVTKRKATMRMVIDVVEFDTPEGPQCNTSKAVLVVPSRRGRQARRVSVRRSGARLLDPCERQAGTVRQHRSRMPH